MVLVVVADVEGDEVEEAVVRVCLLAGAEDVVLSNKVSGDRVQAHAEEGAHDGVDNGAETKHVVEPRVKGEDDGGGDKLPATRGLWVDGKRAEGVEEGLEDAPEDLAGEGVEEDGLCAEGHVDIDNVLALVLVVLEMVAAEAGGGGDAHGHVGDDGEDAVDETRL